MWLQNLLQSLKHFPEVRSAEMRYMTFLHGNFLSLEILIGQSFHFRDEEPKI